MTRDRVVLLILLVLLPLGFRFVVRGLVLEGDTSTERREQALVYFDEEDVERGREYHTAFQPGGAVASLAWWSLMGWLVFSRWPRRLADHAAEWPGGLVTEVLAVGIPAFLLPKLVTLPVSIYHGFVLEGVFGFRRLDFGPWLWRLVKGWGVSGVTQLVLTIGFFWLVRRFPRRWPIPAIGLGAGAGLVMIVLWPLAVLPLFYAVTPLEDGELRSEVVAMATEVGIDIGDVHVIDQSRVSAHTNAFFVGVGDRRSIYLYDTLTENHTVPEIMTIVAHEIGHWQGRHMLWGWLLGLIGLGAGVAALAWFGSRRRVQEAFRFKSLGDVAVIPLLVLLPAAVGTVTAPFENGFSRAFERAADETSFELTADPETFVAMRVTSARTNRTDLLPHPFVVWWYSTHPPALDRIAAAERAAAKPDNREP